MDMSNKTSDKDVANDIEFLKSNEVDALYFRGNPKLKSAIQNILAEREQMKKRYEERDNELWERVKQCNNLQTEIDRIYVDKEELIELNRKRIRQIQELEKELENSIPKQAVIDELQEYKGKIEKYNEYREQGKETDVEYYENIANTIVVQVLQELLEGEK